MTDATGTTPPLRRTKTEFMNRSVQPPTAMPTTVFGTKLPSLHSHRNSASFARNQPSAASSSDLGSRLTSARPSSIVSANPHRHSAAKLTNQTVFEPKVDSPGWKHPLDLVLIAISLPLTVPIMLLIAAFVKVVSPGPIFFAQDRVGYRGRRFKCLKFRTMNAGCDPRHHRDHLRSLLTDGVPMAKLDSDDPRVFFGGSLLRASGLDELAQLFNVLRGEMSLVGPRPCMDYELEHYLPSQMERFEALPGLTGLWQVSGKNRTAFTEMINLDIQYARHQAPLRDMVILFKTPTVLIGQMARVLLKHSISSSHSSVRATT